MQKSIHKLRGEYDAEKEVKSELESQNYMQRRELEEKDQAMKGMKESHDMEVLELESQTKKYLDGKD